MTSSVDEQTEAALKLVDSRLVAANFQCFASLKTGPIELAETKFSTVCRVAKSEKTIQVFFEYSATAREKDEDLFKLSISYFGVFTANKDTTDEQLISFAKLNAPAIIFPLLRATIATLTLGAGVPPLSLPIVNFHKVKVQLEVVD